jgi:hypothetical protein
MDMREKGGKSKYIGVYIVNEKIYARITHKGKQIHLGTFNTEEEAALAYNVKVYELRGEFARLNKVS